MLISILFIYLFLGLMEGGWVGGVGDGVMRHQWIGKEEEDEEIKKTKGKEET